MTHNKHSPAQYHSCLMFGPTEPYILMFFLTNISMYQCTTVDAENNSDVLSAQEPKKNTTDTALAPGDGNETGASPEDADGQGLEGEEQKGSGRTVAEFRYKPDFVRVIIPQFDAKNTPSYLVKQYLSGEHDFDNDSSQGLSQGKDQGSISGDPLANRHGKHKLFVGMLHKSALDPVKTVLMLIIRLQCWRRVILARRALMRLRNAQESFRILQRRYHRWWLFKNVLASQVTSISYDDIASDKIPYHSSDNYVLTPSLVLSNTHTPTPLSSALTH